MVSYGLIASQLPTSLKAILQLLTHKWRKRWTPFLSYCIIPVALIIRYVVFEGEHEMKFIWIMVAILFAVPAHASILADHTVVAHFDSIPTGFFQQIRDNAEIFYGHTSHGSQIVTGVGILAGENGVLYASPSFTELLSDLGQNGSLVWEGQTRIYLDAHPATNIVMWSWCGGCSDNTPEGIDTYLAAMNQLELDYPAVTFIYMTGHLDGTGLDGILYRSNNQIRIYCAANDKILFDFADIESWDPDGNFYPDETDACGWCTTWCASADCTSCGSCAHCDCFNCYQKGKAFWWMMANISGWDPTPVETQSLGAVKSLYR
jgi:hypothetical protein